jgi:ribosomal subunit interface protein
MQIHIQARKFSLTDALRQHAERRLQSALACCNEHIHKINMRLSDINGPRGGADKCCHLQIILKSMPEVVVEDVEANLYIAIDRATDRAGRTVIRKIERKQTLARQAPTLALKLEKQTTQDTHANQSIH